MNPIIYWENPCTTDFMSIFDIFLQLCRSEEATPVSGSLSNLIYLVFYIRERGSSCWLFWEKLEVLRRKVRLFIHHH